MPSTHDYPARTSSYGGLSSMCLEEKFELLKEIGDGSFGSVALARTRTAGAHIARRGTLVAIKTMKKTFDSFAPCLELREVIFLKNIPSHAHLVPALDIFLDPLSKKLHICMENMDGNLYQLMKSRDHKCLDGSSVKSIMFQILSGLGHIHQHSFFHRDIKPENILVSTSAPQDTASTFRRYSSMMTPPSTPPLYTIKIADFGLARETHSPHQYTTYVSTRWYRAPEVLLRAGEYSAPVDIWALGAMAVEIANLKPLFPGSNEVDQVWRVCEIMGSPGNWYDKAGSKVGGGDWREGTKLAQKLGFSFPKMAPHSMETILRPPQWPPAFSNFVTWCLMWDPQKRPTSAEAMQHEYFADAVDPLRPRSSPSRGLNKKHMSIDGRSHRESTDGAVSSKPSWFRKSLIRENPSSIPTPPAEQAMEQTAQQPAASRPQVVHARTEAMPEPAHSTRFRPFANKRASWANGTSPANAAPMPILPSIRPISPFSATVNAQAHNKAISHTRPAPRQASTEVKPGKKIGRQLSVQSQSNHYADLTRQDAERAHNGQMSPQSPTGEQKEGFFSHLRKRARRFSGKPPGQSAAGPEEPEASSGKSPWQSKRNSMAVDTNMDTILEKSYHELDKSAPGVAHGGQPLSPAPEVPLKQAILLGSSATDLTPQRHLSLSKSASTPALDTTSMMNANTPVSSRTRRALHRSTNAHQMYDTPDEEDELLQEALSSAQRASKNMERRSRTEAEYYRKSLAKVDGNAQAKPPPAQDIAASNPYPTPSPSGRRNGILFDQNIMTEPVSALNMSKSPPKENQAHRWPTPPDEDNGWAVSAAASIFAAGSNYH